MTYENKQTDSICSIIKDSKIQEGLPVQRPMEVQLPVSQIAKLEVSISELSIQLAILRSEGAVMNTMPLCTAAITSYGDRKPVICYNCKNKGHIARNCRTKLVQGGRTFVKCFTCGSSSHFVKDCPHIRPKEEVHGGWETNFFHRSR